MQRKYFGPLWLQTLWNKIYPDQYTRPDMENPSRQYMAERQLEFIRKINMFTSAAKDGLYIKRASQRPLPNVAIDLEAQQSDDSSSDSSYSTDEETTTDEETKKK
jgi:hypothetical protein